MEKLMKLVILILLIQASFLIESNGKPGSEKGNDNKERRSSLLSSTSSSKSSTSSPTNSTNSSVRQFTVSSSDINTFTPKGQPSVQQTTTMSTKEVSTHITTGCNTAQEDKIPGPACATFEYKATNTSITLNLTRNLIPSIIGFNFLLNETSSNDSRKKQNVSVANFEGLTSGSKYILHVTALGECNITSDGCSKPVYTRPNTPNCANLTFDTSDTGLIKVKGLLTAELRESIPPNKRLTKTKANGTVVFKYFSFGSNYTMKVWSLNRYNSTIRSSNGCLKTISIPPNLMQCNEIITRNATTSSIMLEYHFKQNDSQNFKDIRVNNSLIGNTVNNTWSAVIGNLSAGRIHYFSIQTVGANGMVSDGNCSRDGITVPENPNCNDYKTQTSTNRIVFVKKSENNCSISIKMEGAETNKTLILKSYNVTFTNLTAGKKYTYTIFTVGDGNQTSTGKCFSAIYTKPPGPSNCNESFQVTDITADLITLSFPKSSQYDFQLASEDGFIWIPRNTSEFNLTDLNPDTLIDIAIKHIIQGDNGQNITSTETCEIKQWTRPYLDCSKTDFRSSTDGLQITPPIDAMYQFAMFISHEDGQNTTSKNLSHVEYLSYGFYMERGTSYTFMLYLIGHGGLSSESTCYKRNVTRGIIPPGCNDVIVKQNTTQIVINPKLLNNTDTGAKYFRLFMRPITHGSLGNVNKERFDSQPLVYINLVPGTEYSFDFMSIGNNDVVTSSYCEVKGHTRPADPNCSRISYSAGNTSINLDLSGPISQGAISYDAEIINGSVLLQNFTSVSQIILDELQIGEIYSIIVTAVGPGNLRSNKKCRKTVYTRPMGPNCNITLKVNETDLGIAFQNYLPKGAIGYILSADPLPTTFSETKLDPRSPFHTPGLSPGNRYNLTWKSYGADDLTSTKLCYSYFYSRPSRPRITSTPITKTSITLNWEIEGIASNYTVLPHCICTTICNFTERNSISFVVKQTQANITDLVPGSYCNVSITANSGDKSSDTLFLSNLSTIEAVPGPVTNITPSLSSRSVTVKWDKPLDPNGKILNYSISIHLIESIEFINSTFILPEKELSVTFGRLTPGSCYMIDIVAATAPGYGRKSTLEIHTNEEVPGPVYQLHTTNASSTSIEISWGKPRNPNGVISSYLVNIRNGTYCIKSLLLSCNGCLKRCPNATWGSITQVEIPTDRKEETIMFNAGKTDFTKTIDGLNPFTFYEVDVYAFTKTGRGALSTNQQRTSEDVPNEISYVSPTTNVRNMTIVFNRPNHPNGIITRYEIECLPENATKKCYKENRTLFERITMRKLSNVNDSDIHNKKQVVIFIEDLQPFWKYTIRIRGYTSVGHGNWSSPVVTQTKPYKPDPVRFLHYTDVTNRNISLAWTEPCFTNGIISQYQILVYKESSTHTLYTTSNVSSIVIPKLLPYTNYNMTVSGVTSGKTGGTGLGVSTGVLRTLCEEPKEPTNLTIVSNTSNSIAVRWKQPVMKTCATEYEVKATDAMNNSIIKNCTTIGFNNVTCIITGLDEYWNYTLTLKAFTKYRNSSCSWKSTLLSRTSQAPPGPVTKVTVETEKNVTKPRTITVRWSLPILRNRNGIIKSFTILYGLTDGATKMQNVSFKSTLSTYKLTITDVPGNYNIRVFATNIYDAKKDDYFNTTNIKLSPGAPPLPKTSVAPLIQVASQVTVNNDEKQFPLSISMDILCNDKYGKITERGVIVSDASQIGGSDRLFRGARRDFLKRKTSIYSTWQSVHDMDNMPPYIATDDLKVTCSSGRTKRSASSSLSYNYVIGLDGECESGQKYCNGYLKPGKSYKARVYVCTDEGCTETNYLSQFKTEPNLVPVIAGGATGGIVAAAVVIIIVIIVIRIRRKRAKDGESTGDGETNFGFDGEMKNLKKGSKTSIQKSQFARKVEDLHADSNLIFAKEYKVIKENSPSHATEAAEQQSTRNKNRYTNILAYDHSRVKLLPTEDEEGSDYINANYIPGFNSQREYIATQGPQNCTKDDFWRMIWEQNVNVIVMLTQLIERGRRKCDQYWPNNTREPVFFGDLIVEMESESPMNDYILRVFSLKLGKNVKNVKHFQFLAWPDMGIPQTTECMLYFVRGVRDHTPAQRRGPIVVHCSAGVGRTGTFIAVDHLMQHVRTHDHLDIFNLVLAMRDNRTNMVQTEDQYIFIHDCIKDYIEELEHEDEDAEDGNVIEEPAYANAAIYANRS